MLVGIDASRDAFIRPVARQDEGGATFTALPDDQFVARQEKTGFYGYLEEGRVCIDSRAVVGLVVDSVRLTIVLKNRTQPKGWVFLLYKFSKNGALCKLK